MQFYLINIYFLEKTTILPGSKEKPGRKFNLLSLSKSPGKKLCTVYSNFIIPNLL